MNIYNVCIILVSIQVPLYCQSLSKGKVPSLLQLAAMKAATLVDKQPEPIVQLPIELQYLLKLPYIKYRWSDFFVRTHEVITLPEGQSQRVKQHAFHQMAILLFVQ